MLKEKIELIGENSIEKEEREMEERKNWVPNRNKKSNK